MIKKCKLLKSKSGIPYAEEFTVFINVNTANLNDFSNSKSANDKIIVRQKRDITNINTVKKYLFISLVSKFILVKMSLFIKTFFGLLNERIWFNEYLVNEYSFKNLNPEPVEKKEPPIITIIKKMKFKLGWFNSREIPIFDILLTNAKKLNMKLLSKLKNIKKILKTKNKYTNKWKSS